MNAPSAIRIVLAGMPGLMGGIVRDTIQGQSDMRIVGDFAQDAALAAALSAAQCDVVVAALQSDARVPATYQALLFGDLPVPFMVLDPDGRRLQAYSRSVRREFAGSELVAVIRRLARPEGDGDGKVRLEARLERGTSGGKDP